MKQFPALLAMGGMMFCLPLWAEDAASGQKLTNENNSLVLSGLCTTYAEEDGIAADKKNGYVADCLNNMTDLSEAMQEDMPLLSEETGEAAASPASSQVNNSPEKLVQNELVETPDPAAEQLDAIK